MDRTVDKGIVPVVIARNNIKRRGERRLPNHGFFNANGASLSELPLRKWGRMPVPRTTPVPIRPKPE